MTPVALLLIGFDRRDSRTDGAQGTSTLDLELFFSIMHTHNQNFARICSYTCKNLTGEIEGRMVLQGPGLGLGPFLQSKEVQKSTKTGNLHKSFLAKLTEEHNE